MTSWSNGKLCKIRPVVGDIFVNSGERSAVVNGRVRLNGQIRYSVLRRHLSILETGRQA